MSYNDQARHCLTTDEYQQQASRTECNQELSRARVAGFCPIDGDEGYSPPIARPTDLLLPVRLNHVILGLAGEVGELASAIESWLYYGNSLDITNIKEELGDCLWYIALACTATGLSLDEVMQANLCKLRVRYPDRYNAESALNRDLSKERKALTGE